MAEVFDLAVIGGGINGCGIARDAAGRGASVYLCEMNDLASGTSWLSTKLIHGGLHYFEYYEFRLAHEALSERETLWRIAPHIVEPLRFVLPYHQARRPAWLMRFGLFLYDYTGGRRLLPPTRTLDLETDAAGRPLTPEKFAYGFEYSDCRVDDARLVALNAIDAARHGAVIETQTAAVAAERRPDHWRLEVRDRTTGARREIRAKTLVNAAGPWVTDTLANVLKMKVKTPLRLTQGSHIVVPRLYEHERAYMLQNDDGRIVFAIPFERDFTLIGATERDYRGDPAEAAASEDEIAYLIKAANAYFTAPISRRDVVWSFSGVRPLYEDGVSAVIATARDYMLETDNTSGLPPLVSVYGGNITTYRRLAEAVLWRLAGDVRALRDRNGWTANAALPGGDMPFDGLAAFTASLRHEYPFLPARTAERLARTYGTEARSFLGEAKRLGDLGADFGHGLSEAELRHLMANEWARTAEDVLWRRTKLGLRLRADEVKRIVMFMATEAGHGRAEVVPMVAAAMQAEPDEGELGAPEVPAASAGPVMAEAAEAGLPQADEARDVQATATDTTEARQPEIVHTEPIQAHADMDDPLAVTEKHLEAVQQAGLASAEDVSEADATGPGTVTTHAPKEAVAEEEQTEAATAEEEDVEEDTIPPALPPLEVAIAAAAEAHAAQLDPIHAHAVLAEITGAKTSRVVPANASSKTKKSKKGKRSKKR